VSIPTSHPRPLRIHNLTGSRHDPDVEYRECECCGHKFKARPDNYRQHLYLHTRPEGKNSRVKFYPKAAAILAREMRKLQERKPPGAPAKRRPGGTVYR